MKRTKADKIGLSVYQRTILQYYYTHKAKYPNAPCFAPRISVCGGRQDSYFKALEKLENSGYIKINRSAVNYTGWILTAGSIKEPESKPSPFT